MESDIVLSIVEDISPGVQRLWTADRRITLFRLSHTSGAAIDAWADTIKQTLTLPDVSNLWIYHFASIPLAGFFDFSTRLEIKFDELNSAVKRLQLSSEHKQYIAILLPGKFVPIARIIASVQKSALPQNATIEIFSSLDDALRWLNANDQASKPHP